eukprot:CAMPEP_0168465764 /NCGR_PEP_ID=MMETSP0228-20121227/56292_1 /TAXON_ID=133427 /ORGANISM="Protoceratium reticulatum, Strain CCCM 535 (=CCMP 1889)" /LENGTH=70 /DNA_ID=CAMNT_0008481367 /DNA_START=117 /DNA_END=325 /DNA_ORIENTATION=-
MSCMRRQHKSCCGHGPLSIRVTPASGRAAPHSICTPSRPNVAAAGSCLLGAQGAEVKRTARGAAPRLKNG